LRRLLNGFFAYPVELAGATARGWNQFVFQAADPTPLGLIRVCVGALLTWSLFVYGLDLFGFFGSNGWMNLEIVQAFRHDPSPNRFWESSNLSWSFWLYVPDSLLRPVWALCLTLTLAFTLGLWSRTTAVLSWMIAVSIARRAPISLYGFDDVLSTWLLYLAFTGASGQAVSVDRFLARWKQNRLDLAIRRKDGRWTPPSGVPRPTIAANIGLRLIQCHLAFIYGMSGLSKFRDVAWWDGTAIWGSLASTEFRLFDLTWLAAYPIVLNLMTHAALFLEVGYPVLIWVKPLRPLILVGVAAMHLGIALTLGLFEFALAMLAANLAFVSGPWLRSLVTGLEQPSGKVLYDGACPRCRASMAFITAGDPDRIIEPIDLTAVDVSTIHPSLNRDACMRSMHLVRRNGKVEEGYDAVMRLLAWIPFSKSVALVRFVPGVSLVGRRVYNWIASTRPRDVLCTDEVCGIHPPDGRAQGEKRPTSTPSGKVAR
jgi:predicted DCC family thiol-disulfide oxidoreductase YuxK